MARIATDLDERRGHSALVAAIQNPHELTAGELATNGASVGLSPPQHPVAPTVQPVAATPQSLAALQTAIGARPSGGAGLSRPRPSGSAGLPPETVHHGETAVRGYVPAPRPSGGAGLPPEHVSHGYTPARSPHIGSRPGGQHHRQ